MFGNLEWVIVLKGVTKSHTHSLDICKPRIEFTFIGKSPKKEVSNALYISVKIP